MALQSNCSVGDDTNSKRRRSYDGDDRLEELDRSEEILREQLKNLCRFKYKCTIQFVDVESELMQVRRQLKCVEKGRAKLADLEFDIFSPTIIRKKITKNSLARSLPLSLCAYQVEAAVSSELQRLINEYRINIQSAFTLKEAETIVNFISTDHDDRRIRSEYVWEDDDLRNQAYYFLLKLLEKIGRSTPLSIMDRRSLSEFSRWIRDVKRMFSKGAWLDELEGFLHENENNTKESAKELKYSKNDLKETSHHIGSNLKFYAETLELTRAKLEEKKAQIKKAKKARKVEQLRSLIERVLQRS